MRQFYYGLALFLFLALPPVRHLLESIMAMHMHMQMMLLLVSGLLMAPFIQKKFTESVQGAVNRLLIFSVLEKWCRIMQSFAMIHILPMLFL